MNIDKLVLHAYTEMSEVDADIEERRFPEAMARAHSLLDILAKNERVSANHINYHLIKPELDKIAREAIAVVYLAYGAHLMRTNPFAAVIHLGHDMPTKEFKPLDSLRRDMQGEAYDSWTSEESSQRNRGEQPDETYVPSIAQSQSLCISPHTN